MTKYDCGSNFYEKSLEHNPAHCQSFTGSGTMSLTKDQIKDTIHLDQGVPKARASELIESLLELIKDTLANGEDVLISGFGKFCVRDKKERRGRNPATGDDMMLHSRKVVTFNCSQVLRSRINGE